jgi:hypothetical protein
MPKGTFGIFQGRRKSAGNAIDEVDARPSPNASPNTESTAFRVLNRDEILERQKQEALRKAQEKPSKFGRLSTFGTSGSKGRTQSIDDDSPSSSKRYVDQANMNIKGSNTVVQQRQQVQQRDTILHITTIPAESLRRFELHSSVLS